MALDIGIAPGFDLLDESETRARTEASILAVLADAATTEGDAVGDLVQVAGGVREAAAQLGRAVSRLDEDGRSPAELAIDEAEASGIDATFQDLTRHACALGGEPRFVEASATIANAAKNKADRASLVSAVVALCEEKRKTKSDSDAARAFFDFRDAFIKSSGGTSRESAVRFMQTWAMRDRFAARSAAYRRLVVRADERARRDRLDAGVLAFADVLRMMRDALLARPDVAARVGGKIDALLVDEFQDTSRVQRDIVALLWEKSPEKRAPGRLPTLADARGSGLLVVGDRKQSIYGFRGASVAVFAESCVLLAGESAREALGIDAAAVRVPPEPTADFVPLRHNRRALPVLLDFANAFSAARLAGSGSDLDEVRYVPATEDLLVPSEKIGQNAIVEPRIFWLRPPTERGTSNRLDEAFVVSARITEILDTGSPHVASDRAPSPRDIAVLSMTNEMLDAVAFALAARGIPYVVAGRGFFSAREVKDVVAFLRVLLGSEDTIALAEILRGPWCGVADTSLLALADGPRGLHSIEAARERASDARVSGVDRERIHFIADLVSRLREDVDRVATGEVLAQAIAAAVLEETLVQLPRGEQRVANVRKLVDMARAFEGSARHLATRWADAVEQASSETEAATFSDEDDA
ncbi:MAG: UvrD-helicase domain-containing protein, partial [Polyangiaceae bacterium]